MNPMDLKRGIDLAVENVLEDLKKEQKNLVHPLRLLRSVQFQQMVKKK